MAESRRLHLRLWQFGLAGLGVLLLLALQGLWFYRHFVPAVADANERLQALIVETARRTSYAKIIAGLEAVAAAEPQAEPDANVPSAAQLRQDFQAHFATAPAAALAVLERDLPVLATGADGAIAGHAELEAHVAGLRSLYTDHHKPLLDDLRRPPLLAWPVAGILAERSRMRQAVTLDRALYLAQVGEIGTARVMLAGLNASVDDPVDLATIQYTLGRLQFELFRAEPEIEYYQQALDYLRQSLLLDPDLEHARRLLDYLLSLPQAATAPQAAEGRPETPSEGEGAAVSAEKRIF